MTKTLAWVSTVALILLLGSCFVAIWWELPQKDDLLKLAEVLLSWKVIAGGLAIGGSSTFFTEISALLKRVAE